MRIKRLQSGPRVLLLLAAMLMAQTLAAAHYDLGKTHSAGDPCALCASISVFGAGNVSVAQAPPPRIKPQIPVASHGQVERAVRIDRIQIRGPPLTA